MVRAERRKLREEENVDKYFFKDIFYFFYLHEAYICNKI